MTDPAPSDPLDLPDDWSDNARATFEGVWEDRPDLSAAEASALWQACALESSADRLDAVALAAGMVATGSTGQTVVHPAAVEARLSRTASAAILARLASGVQTPSDKARRAARTRWGTR